MLVTIFNLELRHELEIKEAGNDSAKMTSIFLLANAHGSRIKLLPTCVLRFVAALDQPLQLNQ